MRTRRESPATRWRRTANACATSDADQSNVDFRAVSEDTPSPFAYAPLAIRRWFPIVRHRASGAHSPDVEMLTLRCVAHM